MNADFMRLLAQRLERVEWVDARLAECAFPESFEGVDGFFMGPDLVEFGSRAEIFAFRGRRLGSIQAWAAQLIHEQGGYNDQGHAWTAVRPHGAKVHDISELALLAMGLAEEEQLDREFSCLILDDHAADALLSPSFLHGRMRGIGPPLRRVEDQPALG
ncbi:MAG: hypothetical protein OXP66_04150, partial [Candidatus Tectomicrobia bacterium]|nr:hypothetical protein [Candidatus Tectomicrobia bacterium]